MAAVSRRRNLHTWPEPACAGPVEGSGAVETPVEDLNMRGMRPPLVALAPASVFNWPGREQTGSFDLW